MPGPMSFEWLSLREELWQSLSRATFPGPTLMLHILRLKAPSSRSLAGKIVAAFLVYLVPLR